MKRFIRIYLPVILVGIMIGTLTTTYTPKFKTVSPIEDNKNKTIEEIIIDKGIELKLVPKSDVIVNGSIGGVLGWIITKLLDLGVTVIKRKRRNEPKDKPTV